MLPAIAVILTFLPQSLAPLVSPARDDAVARHLSEALESETCPTDAPFMNVEECDWSAQPRRVKLGGSFLMTEEYLMQLGPDGEESGIDFVHADAAEGWKRVRHLGQGWWLVQFEWSQLTHVRAQLDEARLGWHGYAKP